MANGPCGRNSLRQMRDIQKREVLRRQIDRWLAWQGAQCRRLSLRPTN